MDRSSLALLVLLLAVVSVHGQTLTRADDTTNAQTDQLAARAICALKRLETDVLVYRSLEDFEADGKLARVSFATFRIDLHEVTAEVESILLRLPQSRLKLEITNALDSYRDGAFWWQETDQPRVVDVSTLTASNVARTPSDSALLTTVPYTVTIHWRHAAKYLNRTERVAAASLR